MPVTYRVPGVYHEPRPRVAPPAAVRTDVAGFIGFESRVRDGTTPSRLTGGPPATGHAFRVDVAGFEIELAGAREEVPATTDLVLSENPAATLVADAQSVVFALAAAREAAGITLVVTAGAAAATGPLPPAAPSDLDVESRVAAVLGAPRPWLRIADVELRRVGQRVWPLVRPALPPTRCDDWRDFGRRLGEPVDDGSLLAPAVRAYFANGGSRCFVETVSRPLFDDPGGLARARAEMLGVQGASKAEATGLEQLLLVEEVSFVDVPDLYARRVVVDEAVLPLPPFAPDACFRDCRDLERDPGAIEARGPRRALEPLFAAAAVEETQHRMVERAAPERWRVLLLFSPPLQFDPATGARLPTAADAEAWRQGFAAAGVSEEERSVAALYFPWLLAQERVGAPVLELPPTPFAAGVIARRDLARGPHVAPANESLRGVVGLGAAVDDDAQGTLYEPPLAVNAIRPFSGYGIQVWGARTLSGDAWLRFLAVRRCLTAIEKRVARGLEELVFEPNTPILWLRVTQLVFGVLEPVFESGALRGSRPEEAFFVRCDETNNPPEAVAEGRLLCEVGVAIAATAEFLIFRVGRREGVIEVLE